MKIKINPVNNGTKKTDRNRFCGPAVISSITKMTTAEAARLIRHFTGERKVTGTHTHDLISSFNACGVKVQWVYDLNTLNKPTLAGWLKHTIKERTADRVFLVIAGNHFQLVQGRRYVCGITRSIVSIKDKKVKRRSRVETVYELTASDKITIPEQARKPKRIADQHRPFINKMKAKYGFEVDYERWNQTYWVSMPQDAEDLAWDMGHHLRDEHGCYDLSEVASRFDAMVEFMEENFPQKIAA